jgi:hypothetical protein
MDGMSRRKFLGTTLDATLLATVATALQPLCALAGNAPAGSPVFFDPRFAAARVAAAHLAGSDTLLPVAADPTDMLAAALRTASTTDRPRLRGVTPESIPFCLSQLTVRGERPTLSLHRIDQDLFAWQLDFPT